jgi:hypothetical protein
MRLFVSCALVAVLLFAPASALADPPRRGHFRHDGHQHGRHRHSHFWFDLNVPWGWCGFDTPAFVPFLPTYHIFGYTVFVPPPTLVNVVPPAPANPPVAANNPAPPADPPPEPAAPKTTNPEHKARAGRYLGFGDAAFAKQKYLGALERYKTATLIAPDVAESYFRQGFAQAALAHYDRAAEAFRRGLRVRSDWSASPFTLDDLYDGAALAKTGHLESLAAAVDVNAFDADLLLVLGMHLYFDGQADRATVFFSRSDQLGGNADGLLDTFLGKPRPAAAPGAQQPAGKISF